MSEHSTDRAKDDSERDNERTRGSIVWSRRRLLQATGAATATATAYLVRNAAMTWYLHSVYDIQPFSRWLLIPLAPVVLVAGILRWVVPEPSLPFVIGYALILVITITFGYLSSGIEEADLILSELIEENTGVDLKLVKRIHEGLR